MIPRPVLAIIERRSGGLCELCGGKATNTHHRRSRGMGGSRDPVTNSVVNLLRLCGSGTTGCHGHIERNRTWAYENGLLVPRYGPPVGTVPVHLQVGLVLLTPQGGYQPVGQ